MRLVRLPADEPAPSRAIAADRSELL